MIEAAGIEFGYRRGTPILHGWSASVAPGEAVAIVGPSGCGKSTALYLLGMLVRPWSGVIRIAGERVDHLGDASRSDLRAGTVGFVFQDAILDPRRSVMDNILEPAVYRGTPRAEAHDRAAALVAWIGLEVEPSRRATDLSGGQAQRVALCRALLHDPAIILADEPTGNLDRANASVVEDALFDRARHGSALVIVTHDERLAARCDRQYRL